jgi:2-succinyl-6-hydroxy-2,4-cyclohexadiene-1-carboxylate synthase
MPEQRLVFLHGFTQTHHHWHRCASLIDRTLGDDPTLVFVDLPGHGLSSGDRLTIEQAALEMVALAGDGTYIGYSMGARHALAAACAGAPEIERLVLIGGTAGLADAGARHARVADDEAKAVHLEAVGVEAFVDEWLAQPMFAGLPVTSDDRRHRLRNTVDGLAASLRLAGTGAQAPLWDVLPTIAIPVLVLAGARDPKFTEIGRRLAGAIPAATFAPIPDAGHAAHTEAPEALASLVGDWLLAQPSARPTASSAP